MHLERLAGAEETLAARVPASAAVSVMIAADVQAAASRLLGRTPRDQLVTSGGATVCHGRGIAVVLACSAQPETLPAGERALQSLSYHLVEEFRVERGIYEEGASLPPEPYRDMLARELAEAEGLCFPRGRRGEADLGRALDAVDGLLRRVTHVLGADVATGGALAPTAFELWMLRAGDRYDRLRTLLCTVPASTRPDGISPGVTSHGASHGPSGTRWSVASRIGADRPRKAESTPVLQG